MLWTKEIALEKLRYNLLQAKADIIGRLDTSPSPTREQLAKHLEDVMTELNINITLIDQTLKGKQNE